MKKKSPSLPAKPPSPLDALKPEDLVKLSDPEYRETIKLHARSKSPEALETYVDVMQNSDDDQARVNAADRVMKFSEAQEEKSVLPAGLTPEVFAIALAGLGKLASIARENAPSSILRNVTPAAADPRSALPSLDPLNAPVVEQHRADDEEPIEETLTLPEE